MLQPKIKYLLIAPPIQRSYLTTQSHTASQDGFHANAHVRAVQVASGRECYFLIAWERKCCHTDNRIAPREVPGGDRPRGRSNHGTTQRLTVMSSCDFNDARNRKKKFNASVNPLSSLPPKTLPPAQSSTLSARPCQTNTQRATQVQDTMAVTSISIPLRLCVRVEHSRPSTLIQRNGASMFNA